MLNDFGFGRLFRRLACEIMLPLAQQLWPEWVDDTVRACVHVCICPLFCGLDIVLPLAQHLLPEWVDDTVRTFCVCLNTRARTHVRARTHAHTHSRIHARAHARIHARTHISFVPPIPADHLSPAGLNLMPMRHRLREVTRAATDSRHPWQPRGCQPCQICGRGIGDSTHVPTH